MNCKTKLHPILPRVTQSNICLGINADKNGLRRDSMRMRTQLLCRHMIRICARNKYRRDCAATSPSLVSGGTPDYIHIRRL